MEAIYNPKKWPNQLTVSCENEELIPFMMRLVDAAWLK